MHTYKHRDGTTFIHNGDYSGDVIIRSPNDGSMPVLEIHVPMTALIDFVANAVRSARISRLESATPSDILGLSNNPVA